MAKRRDLRPIFYGVLDLLFATIHFLVIVLGAANRHGWAQDLMLCIPTLGLALGVCTLMALSPSDRVRSVGWRGAVISGGLLLIFTIVILGLLLASAAFLTGVYGSFGRAAASGVLAAAALIVELVALLPSFQLKYLLTRAGRRAYGLAPLWGSGRS